jgi:peptidoglycan/LPS O-acetylase OafA/YrhL
VFRRTPKSFNRFFKLIGSVSLEAYLIHLHFVMNNVEPYHLGYWATFLITVVVTLPLAWLLHQAIELMEKGVLGKINKKGWK